MITGAYDVFRPHDINSKYFYYYYLSLDNNKLLKPLYTGLRKVISYPAFTAMKFPVPPKEEQDQIVRYLDWQISNINKLIHGYQQEIKLLEERRQSVIDIATTQGIDNAKMKESGTHWIKEIPEHWEMVYSKKLFAERKDKAYPGDEQLTSSQKYGIISQREFMEKEGRRVTVVMTGNDILKHVGKGDFVISMRSFQGGLEYSYVDGKISSAYVMLIPRKGKVYDEYFKWLLKSRQYIRALQGTADLVRDGQALRYANFAKVPLPIIPLDEQKRISDYIQAETDKIDKTIPGIIREIELLREYRTRLISDVVTGQLDVRGIEIPDYTPVEDVDSENESEEEEVMESAD
jgi:type I restriction enzyme S subunit